MAEDWELVLHVRTKKLEREFQPDELVRIREALRSLRKMALNDLDIKKLEGWRDSHNRDIFRVRVGRDIRILVSFDPENRQVHVWKIARRESVYDG